MDYVFIFLMGVLLTLAAIAVVKRYSRKDDANVLTNAQPSLLKEPYQGIPLDPHEDILEVFDLNGAQVGKFNLDSRQNLEDLYRMINIPNWPDRGLWVLENKNKESITGTFYKEADTLTFWR